MNFAVQSTIVFFGTLLAAALVALGDPALLELEMARPGPINHMLVSVLGWTN